MSNVYSIKALSTLIIIFLVSCSEPCKTFENEIYTESNSNLNYELKQNFDVLFLALGESNIDSSAFETYRFFYGAYEDSLKVLLKVTNENSDYVLRKVVFTAKSLEQVTIYQDDKIDLNSSDWNALQSNLYEHKYWTQNNEGDLKGIRGASLYIEGSRPQAKSCGKRIYHLIHKWNPKNDPLFKIYKGLFEK
ncbi:MAG: hypothetical protein ACPGSD_06710 [Flavobacteriales bacterium]